MVRGGMCTARTEHLAAVGTQVDRPQLTDQRGPVVAGSQHDRHRLPEPGGAVVGAFSHRVGLKVFFQVGLA